MRRTGWAILLLAACSRPEAVAPPPAERPSILFITLDTTRADAIGPDQNNVATPAYDALVKEGLRFRYAYATVPQTLPSHTSMLTGLYPGGHGVHENGRYLAANQPLVSERLKGAGYRTAAFVSAFALSRRFGLGRGFDLYDEDFGEGREERNAKETTDRVLVYLDHSPAEAGAPVFLWVHYWDPHYPYTPPEPYRTRYAKQPYYGEIAFMDEQLGRLVQAFRQRVGGPKAIIIAGDHGEGLGDHGEAQHGNLLYQSTMHVPMLLIGPGVNPGTTSTPVSTRTIAQKILDFAGIKTDERGARTEDVVAAEAMKPFLDYGWQPQVMAVDGRQKAIRAGRIEIYDVVSDPGEMHDLAAQASLSRQSRATLRDYPMPSAQATAPPSNISDEERRKLAALGYIASTVKPVIRADAPRPADMSGLFPTLDKAAALFVAGRYRECIPLLEQILSKDPHNLDTALRLATAYSSLGQDRQALAAFERAGAIAPDSQDVRTYLALHYARGKDWPKAVPLLERVVAESPDRVPALEALAVIRERQGRLPDAVQLRQKIYALRAPTNAELERLGSMQMALGQTEGAMATFQRVPGHDLELGVLYLAAGRLAEARDALDRVPPTSPQYAMALFKRAQVSVLLHENDAPSRIEMARRHATPLTRELIARERLFH
ncbi:MAG TPA: sulfatase-like hydrolase/transferase [Thermoanaerobaculia bacterium]|nr:sulfatase-like hydrolase/transferase [Thermoanaerobaculia bacterium]